jgi:hypothetical protein
LNLKRTRPNFARKAPIAASGPQIFLSLARQVPPPRGWIGC